MERVAGDNDPKTLVSPFSQTVLLKPLKQLGQGVLDFIVTAKAAKA